MYIPVWIRGTKEDQDQYIYLTGSLRQSAADPEMIYTKYITQLHSVLHRVYVVCDWICEKEVLYTHAHLILQL